MGSVTTLYVCVFAGSARSTTVTSRREVRKAQVQEHLALGRGYTQQLTVTRPVKPVQGAWLHLHVYYHVYILQVVHSCLRTRSFAQCKREDVFQDISVCFGLEELLAHLFRVRADHDKEAIGEADENVAVSEPVVAHEVAIARRQARWGSLGLLS